MPQDPYLYGRPAKKAKKSMGANPDSLSFAAQMTSLISSSSTSKPSKPTSTENIASSSRNRKQDSVFTMSKEKFSKKGKVDKEKSGSRKVRLKSPTGTHEEARERDFARQKMEAKAKLYNSMKRGERRVGEGDRAPLIDFDTKWANRHDPGHPDFRPGSSSSRSGSEDGNGTGQDEAMMEWEDEFGRHRQGTRAEYERHTRRMQKGILGQEELERISARPSAPQNVIYGDTVQTYAFRPTDETRMEALAQKRDRSATPPELKHYDASWEIRDKGVGFYAFSQTEAKRQEEMENLEKERKETEKRRMEREDARTRRKRELAERRELIETKRRELETKRAGDMAEEFLKDLEMEVGASDAVNKI